MPVLQDSLTPVHQYVEAVLGAGHPVAMEMGQLAAANESPAIRAARAEKQRVTEARTMTVVFHVIFACLSMFEVSRLRCSKPRKCLRLRFGDCWQQPAA